MAMEIIVGWALIGLLGVVALIALIVGAVKSYTGLKPNGLSWALACGAFLLIVKGLVETDILSSLPIFANATVNTTNFVVAVLILSVIAFALTGLFAAIATGLRNSFNGKVKKAEKIKYAEARGEEFEIDENREYRPLPIDGKSTPRIGNRVFGALTAMVNAVAFTAGLLAVVMFVLALTPLAAEGGLLQPIYTQGATAVVWGLVRQYTLDFLIISFVMFMIRKGWEVGFLEGLRKLIVFAGYVAVVVGPFVLMFSTLVVKEAPLAFLGDFGAVIGNLLISVSNGMVPAAVALIVGKILVGVVLLIVGLLLMALINWLLIKFVDLVDDVKIFSWLEKTLATVVFFVFGIAVVFVVFSVMYTLGHFAVFDCSVFFTESSVLSNGFFGAAGEWLTPLLDQIVAMLSA